MNKKEKTEKEFFCDLLNNLNNLKKEEYLKEYNKKSKYNYREIKDIKQFDTDDLIWFINSNKEFITNEIKSIKDEYLYKSNIHGLSHNIKTMLFGILIGKKENLSNDEIKIIIDACKYHDIGRINDFEDKAHGFRSSGMTKIITQDDKFYNDQKRNDMLKGIIEMHSLNDSEDKKIAEKYNLNYI